MAFSRLSSYDSSKSSLSDQASSESLFLRPISSKGSLTENQEHQEFCSTENLHLPGISGGQTSSPLSLSPSPRTSSSSSAVFSEQAYMPPSPQVPKIVESCTNYLKKHGSSPSPIVSPVYMRIFRAFNSGYLPSGRFCKALSTTPSASGLRERDFAERGAGSSAPRHRYSPQTVS